MPQYRVKLSDGRTVMVEAATPPSEQEVLSALGTAQAPAEPPASEQEQPPAYIRSGSPTKARLGHLLSEEPATLGALGSLGAMAAPLLGVGTGLAGVASALAPGAAQLLTRGYRKLTGQAQKPIEATELLDYAAGPALQYGPKAIAAGGRFIASRPAVQRSIGAVGGGYVGNSMLPGVGAFGGALIGREMGKDVVRPLAEKAAMVKPVTESAAALRQRLRPTPPPTSKAASSPFEIANYTPSKASTELDPRVSGLPPSGPTRAERAIATAMPTPSRSKALTTTVTENDLLAMAKHYKTTPEEIKAMLESERAGRASLYRTNAEIVKRLKHSLSEE